MKRVSILASLVAGVLSFALPSTAQELRQGVATAEATKQRAEILVTRNARLAERRARDEARQRQRLAARKAKAEVREAAGFRRTQVDGSEVAPRVEKVVTELEWHDSFESAQKAARASGKPILHIQALGDLDGLT